MDKRVLGRIGFASLFATMMVIGLFGVETPLTTFSSQAQATAQTHALKAENNVAFTTIFPAYVPHSLPVPDMTDVATEAGLGKALPPQESKGSAKKPDKKDSSVRVHERPGTTRRTSSTQSPKHNTTVRNTAVLAGSPIMSPPDDERLPSPVSAHTTLQSREFSALLRPEGFHRPEWQDVSFAEYLDDQTPDVKPFVVIIDPGHGGTDPGSKGYNGLLEKDLTLDIARRIRLFLTEVDEIDVQLTRHHDHGLSRQSRVDFIKRSKADMVISLHFNHLPQADVNLVESYYAGPKNILESRSAQRRLKQAEMHRTSSTNNAGRLDFTFTEGSARLAHDLQQRVFAEVSFENDHVQNAGVKQETFFVLTRSYKPSVLMEISCLSYPEEADKLDSEEYRNRLAAAMVDGIRNYHDSLQSEPLKKPGDLGV